MLSSCESRPPCVLDWREYSVAQKAVSALPGGAQELSPLLFQDVLDNIWLQQLVWKAWHFSTLKQEA